MQHIEKEIKGCWEVFEEGPTVPREDRLYVTMNHKSVIHLNGNVHDALGRPAHVLLLFDRLNSCIGVMPVKEALPNSFPLKEKGVGRHRLIWARTFCRHYGIGFMSTRAFKDPHVDDDGVLRLDLKSTLAAEVGAHYRKAFSGGMKKGR